MCVEDSARGAELGSGGDQRGFGGSDGGDRVQVGAELIRRDGTEVSMSSGRSPIRTWIDGSVVTLKRSSRTLNAATLREQHLTDDAAKRGVDDAGDAGRR